jgi:flagellar biogenesis protein FliO
VEWWLVVASIALAIALIVVATEYIVMRFATDRTTLYSQILLIVHKDKEWYVGPLQSLTTVKK